MTSVPRSVSSTTALPALPALLCMCLMAACGPTGQPAASTATASAANPGTVPPTFGPTIAPTLPVIGPEAAALTAGTYVLDLGRAPTVRPRGGTAFGTLTVSVPDHWNSFGGWALNRGGLDSPIVAVQFWTVEQVFGHPCQWNGTLSDPGASVVALANALAAVPLRHATAPADVTLDGYAGKYLEWSVPAGFDFDTCDLDGANHDFESWTGPNGDSDRYQQGPGQVDRLWILDIHGDRLVIDAFDMPVASAADRAELLDVVDTIHFDLRP